MSEDSLEKNEVMEYIREELRGTISEERKRHRRSVLNKQRTTLEDPLTDLITEDFVRSKANLLKKKPLRMKEYQRLQNAFVQDLDNINTFMKVDNAVAGLARCLSGSNAALQLAAANCCCNLALGNSKTCKALCKSVGPYVVAMLEGLSNPHVEVCAWTIGNLVGGSYKAFEILHAQDCLGRLMSLLQECDKSILSTVIYATMHYVRTGYHQIEDADMIDLTKAVVKLLFNCQESNLIWLLALLSSRPACFAYLTSAVPMILEYLYNSANSGLTDVVQVTAATRFLANLVCEETGSVVEALLNDPDRINENLRDLIDKLMLHAHAHLRKEALWLIGNIYNHSSRDYRQSLRDNLLYLPSIRLAAASVVKSNLL
ncbi:importin subunit alpha-9 [Orussus abietinus]|uniref:importin subunit alpha-9 n=1 Tax=Orussus abietinus TaxID=222816 RepID=UPI00062642B2|nr:importin subunit alpha-9 [Orussus abietinus]